MAKKSTAKAAKKKGARKASRASKSPKRSTARKASPGTRRANKAKKAGSSKPTKSAKNKAKNKKVGRTSAGRTSAARKNPAAESTARKTSAKSAAAKTPAKRTAPEPIARKAKKSSSTGRPLTAVGRRPNLDRERRTIREEEEMVPSPPSSLNMDRSASAARTGRAEYEQRLREHTSTGPALTGGDIDADWEDAEAVGDEAPGGDNPTPDQDVVDEIGRAMGIEYDDDEELQGGDELNERDRHRWELDPASKEDFEED
jgi:hypothetical protein